MADTLTQLIAKVQAQLIDGGTLFNAATVTAAMRQALADINKAVPQNAAVILTSIANQKEYELSDQDPTALRIFAVLLQGLNDVDTDLPFYAYNEDSRVFFRLREALAAGKSIIVRYTTPHTISGLDGSLDSTLPDDLNVAAINGACYYSALIRSAATIESNNIAKDVATNWNAAAGLWKRVFDASLRSARQRPTPRGEPSTQAWNDNQHSELYP